MAFFLITAEHQLADLERLQHAELVGLDIETAGPNALNPYQDRIRLIQLADGEDCFVIDLDRVDPMAYVRPLLESEAIVKVIHNAKFEVKHFLHHYGLEIRHLFCTRIASTLLAKGQSMRHGLAAVCQRWLGRAIDKTMQTSDWSGSLNEEQLQYAATDAEVLVDLYQVMAPALASNKLNKVSKLEFRTVVPVAAMELRGIYVDQERLAEVEAHFRKKRAELEEAVLAELSTADALPGMNVLNLNAPDQVKQALADRGIDVPDTLDARLRPLAETYPFIGALLDFRHIDKILASGLRPLHEHVLPETKRVHATYHQIASASGRFACSNPNIQQTPREKMVRGCVRPEPGNVYIIADYSQVELRVAAGLSGDGVMLDAYRKGGDLHRLTAAITMGKNESDVTSEERQAAKAINFGLIYAMGARGLQQSARASYGVKMDLEQATVFRQRYFENYRGISNWQHTSEQLGKRRRYVRTAAGRIRAYADGEEIRVTELFNTPVQGTAAEGLKSAMCIFWERVKKEQLDAAIVAIIHDEIIVECKQEQAEQTKKALEESMIQGISWLIKEVPFEAEAAITDSWAGK